MAEQAQQKVGIIAFTAHGVEVAKRIAACLEGADVEAALFAPERLAAGEVQVSGSLGAWTASAFAAYDALVFVGATGIAVRAIAPHVRDKFTDPAVISVDELGRFVIPLLSGHVGGANELARRISCGIDAQAIVTTATDGRRLFAIDEWASRNGFAIVERVLAKEVSAALLDGKTVGFASDFPVEGALPAGFVRVGEDEQADACELGVALSFDERVQPFAKTLHLVPRKVCVGVGCRRDTPAEALEAYVLKALEEAGISTRAVCDLASIDVKSDEPAVLELAARQGWELAFYSAQELESVPGDFASSDFVRKTVGVGNVCERAAAFPQGVLHMGRHAHEGMTVAAGYQPFAVTFDQEAARTSKCAAATQ